MPLSVLTQLLENSADGAYVVDNDQRVVSWNAAAQRILGYTAQEVIGRNCHTMLSGRGDGGCLICRRDCAVIIASRRGKLSPSFDAQVRRRDGQTQWVNISIIPVTEDSASSLGVVHLFRDISVQKQTETFAAEVVARARQLNLRPTRPNHESKSVTQPSALTLREFQVLSLLAQGANTADISTELVVTESTVRNHVQHILHKLAVHSRLEAVAYARENHLLD
jgi:PAS domain S-box-containing protein